MPIDIATTAGRVLTAKKRREPIGVLIRAEDEPTTADAFRVQREVIRRQVEAGDRVAGFKLGNIAKAMQTKFGVDEPDYGFLLASQFYPENLPLKESEFIEPFVELEPAFIFRRDVGGAHVTAADIMAATDFVVPGTQITGRFAGWGEIGFDYVAST